MPTQEEQDPDLPDECIDGKVKPDHDPAMSPFDEASQIPKEDWMSAEEEEEGCEKNHRVWCHEG